MNKIQKITVLTMVAFAAVMFAGPIALNSGVNSAFAGGGDFFGHHHEHHHHHHHFFFFFHHEHHREHHHGF